MDLMDGNLRVLYQSDAMLPLSERTQLLLGVAVGMNYLHRQGLVHRDLKSTSVLWLLQRGGRIAKITDFGVAKWLATGER